MTFKHFFAALRYRIWLITAIVGVVLAAVVAVSLSMTPRYSAQSRVLIDVKSPDPVAGSVLPAHLLASYIATQVELIGSERVALRVVERLGLARSPDVIRAYAERDVKGDESIELFVARLLLEGLKVRPSKDTNLLDIAFSSLDRQLVAPIANAFVDAYADETVDIRVGPARQSRDFFVEQANQYREVLQKATARLNEFRASRGLTSTDERDDIEMLRLQQLQSQLTEAQNSRIEATRRGDAATTARRDGSSAVSEVLGNSLIQSLKGELARTEARLQERSAVYGSDHPEMVRLRREIESIQTRLATETDAIVQSLARTSTVAAQREAELAEQVRRQRAVALGNKTSRETILTLQRDVDLAQRNFDSVSQRVTQASLESQATQANVSVVSRATTPALPSTPNLPLNVSIAVVLGSLLGVLAALVAESFHGRIRFAEDLARATGAEVLAILRSAPVRTLALGRSGGANANRLTHREGKPDVHPDTTEAPGGGMGDTTPESARPVSSRHGIHDTESDAAIGEMLIDSGSLSPAEVADIAESARAAGVRFEDVVVQTGKVSREAVALARSVRQAFPLLDPKTSSVAPQVVAAFNLNNAFMDDLRILRTQIKAQFRRMQADGGHALAIVSQGIGEGKTITCANLAVSFAQLGDRVLLIDGDMRTGRLHQLFALDNEAGFSSLLGMRCKIVDVLQQVPGLSSLSIIPAGPEPISPTDMLGQDVLEQLLGALSRNFDIVLIDTPGASERPDASLIAIAAKNYVVVARHQRTVTAAVEALTRKFDRMGARMLGSVLVRA
jgi:chain length determinant protein EpsF